ncbi:phospholipid phosphatase 2-like [Cimex lectularius]|uniref:Phosphatidic acid phosphatase type 2/haloperoxidase domain-containing protein n=1 Tax=Cimex lectularius TaxID=79782 RepID=A0A8I6TDG2_CIMLE|nr:phospholipid phosphatase 2-like [Cimex lectularius]
MFAMENSQISSYILPDIVSIMGSFIISLALVSFVQPRVQGFDCKNISIRYPQKPSTISATTLLNSSLGLPTCFIVGLESIIQWKKKPQGPNKTVFALKLFNTIAVFYTAFNMQFTIGTLLKLIAGEPRPYFLEACEPNVDCSDPAVNSRFVNVYNCTGDKSTVRRARGGFLSVKTSSMTTSMVYIALLTEVKLQFKEIFLGKLFLQFLFVSIALFIGASRVVDHEHKWADVVLGFCLGTATSIAAAFATNWFQQNISVIDETTNQFPDDNKMKVTKGHLKKGFHMHTKKGFSKSPRGSIKPSPERQLKGLIVKKNKVVPVRKLSYHGKRHSKRDSMKTARLSAQNPIDDEPLLQ